MDHTDQIKRIDESNWASYSKKRSKLTQPTIISQNIINKRACDTWSVDYLRNKFADDRLELNMAEDSDPRKNISLGDYLEQMQSGELPSHFYLMNWHGFQRHQELQNDLSSPKVLKDWSRFPLVDKILAKIHQIEYWSIYIGPKGTRTPLHRARSK